NCRAVTIVSRSWGLALDRRFQLGSKLNVITNGYDPEDFVGVKPHQFGHFSIVYAGIFYSPVRVVTPVMEVLKRLSAKKEASECYFHYYGEDDVHVRNEADRVGVTQYVKIHGKVPRAEVLSAIKGASLAVVITSVSSESSPEIDGWIPAKLFEPIGLSTPVLLIAPPGTDAESLTERTGLVRRFTADDIEGIAGFIKTLMRGASFSNTNVDSITWNYLARRFDTVLRAQLYSAHAQHL